jgi:hypothetical protein
MNVSHRLGFRVWRCVRLAGAVLALPLVLWACTSHPLQMPQPQPEAQTDDFYAVNPIRDIDMLFVIDNSGSTQNKQDNFAANFPAFITALQMIPGGLPNVRIGVVTNDYGAGGALTANGCHDFGDNAAFQINDTLGANCGLQPGAFWITGENLLPGRTLQQVFACMATRGTKGCGHEAQLQSARMALLPRMDRNPMNMGFLRPDAYLAVIFLTDEEDSSAAEGSGAFWMGPPPLGFADNARAVPAGHLCMGMPPAAAPLSVPLADCTANPNPPPGTLVPVQDVVNDIKGLKPGHEEKIVVAAIAGWPPPGAEAGARYSLVRTGGAIDLGKVCEQAGGGTPGLRIKAFLDSFKNNTLQTICQASYAGALTAIGNLVGSVVGNPCISAPLVDMDTAKMGVQADCVVEEGMTGQKPILLPQCGAQSTKPCWSIATANNCQASGFQIAIDRGGAMPTVGVQDSIKCRTCAKPGDQRCRRM